MFDLNTQGYPSYRIWLAVICVVKDDDLYPNKRIKRAVSGVIEIMRLQKAG